MKKAISNFILKYRLVTWLVAPFVFTILSPFILLGFLSGLMYRLPWGNMRAAYDFGHGWGAPK